MVYCIPPQLSEFPLGCCSLCYSISSHRHPPPCRTVPPAAVRAGSGLSGPGRAGSLAQCHQPAVVPGAAECAGCHGRASKGHFQITPWHAWLGRKPRVREAARLGAELGCTPRCASQRGFRSPCTGDREEGGPGLVASLLALFQMIILTFCCHLKILK